MSDIDRLSSYFCHGASKVDYNLLECIEYTTFKVKHVW